MKTTLSFPPCGTDIPYFDPTEFDPAERHEYVDLRTNPAGIDELPELAKEPRFKDYLLQINGADTIFQSFGCNFSFFPGEEEVIGPPIPPSKEPQKQRQAEVANSYVHVGFADLNRCTNLDDYYRLAGRLCKHLHGQPDFAESEDENEYFNLEIGLETLRMNGEDKGFILALTCDTLGWDEQEAKDRWAALMETISHYLANEKL
ncbi:hypothetical protein [Zavarzinella formosa]|uniref:hypothetical protein n=1 Tax=Zavarzinella formosa TaxID=360055 RepID=UPI00037CACF5|nr:hypothetical protein [Zavarzinella formosa]